MRILSATFFLSLVLLAEHVPALATATATQTLTAVAAPHPLALDPLLSDPAWKTGAIPDDTFFNVTTRKPAQLATAVYLLYDDKNLYVGFHATQQGTAIAATQSANDVGFGIDDFVGVGIDTTGNGQQVYFFETTPKGVRYQQASENARYRPVWQSAASITGGDWSAVMIIPLKSMRIAAGSVHNWRINFLRNVSTASEHYSWAGDTLLADAPSGAWPVDGESRFWPTLASLRFAGTAPATRATMRTDIYALASAGANRKLFAQANGSFMPETVRNAGIDFTYPVTNTINIVGTANPDFSNVEIDQQTIAPQEFRRVLQEYRPFFTQGASFINSNPYAAPNYIFYSPGVGPFDRGVKAEGTYGHQSFGVLNFRGYDQTTGNVFDDTAYGFRHILPDHSFLYWVDGVEAHHSLSGHDSTNEAGIAARNVKSGILGQIDEAVETGGANGGLPVAHSFSSFVVVHKPNYTTQVTYLDTSPFYNPLDGFSTISDIRGPSAYINITGTTPFLKNYGFFAQGDRFVDRSGAAHQADTFYSFSATFKNGFSINGIGPSVGLLRRYAADNPDARSAGGARIYPAGCADPGLPYMSFTGSPHYYCGQTDRYNLMSASFGFRDGTSAPLDWSVSEGPFGNTFLHLYTVSTSRPLGNRYSIAFEYDGTYTRDLVTSKLESQWLRRITVGETIGQDSNLSVSLRGINGVGGFALPGLNLAASFHRHFTNGNDLYVNYGTPAANQTLNRLILKYIFRQGGAAGT